MLRSGHNSRLGNAAAAGAACETVKRGRGCAISVCHSPPATCDEQVLVPHNWAVSFAVSVSCQSR
eukprot:7941351-Prorocentrum_lima.AAC.1